MPRYIYADNAATTRTGEAAKAAMLHAMEQQWGNPSSLYTLGQYAKEGLEAARTAVAAVIGADAKEIIFTSGGSEADNQAIRSAAYAGAKKGKKHLISTAFEHHAVLHTLQTLEKEGFAVTLLDVHENGVVTAEDVAAALRPDTALVSVMAVNNEIGTVMPIEAIGSLCRERGVVFHTDAVQAVGHMPLDVHAMKIDMLSASAHKFGGPRGAGFLYVRRGVPVQPLIAGGAQERNLRAGTENLPAIAGMAAALQQAAEGMVAEAARLTAVRERLIAGLSAIPHSRLNGDRQQRNPGTVNFCFEGIEGESLLLLLDAAGIAASSGSACTSGSLDPSHVLLALGLPHEVAHGSLRLSPSAEITDDEVEHIIDSVGAIVARLRAMSPVWDALENGERPHLI
ncbi:MAG: aminotransferase class V-fold PLP-dependent enzyme [Oscillospiraceae bacterium]|nr:aminotransferase class V-fold PLP-dependent enzyme [Oscillospiraceae bacterium]